MDIDTLVSLLENVRDEHGNLEVDLMMDRDIIGVDVRKGYPNIEPPLICIIKTKDIWDNVPNAILNNK